MSITKNDVLKVITDPNEQTVTTSRGRTKVYRPSLARIAEKLKISKPTAQYYVNKLEEEGSIPEHLQKLVN